ncbi:N-acetylmuramoyl-L-alanine amidase [Dongia deserti]|uniref:N-acetylmuramoyl-L-alanine amidase n=1 Tax=Dongia deserti TaxID=2268030 RepID=UPI000E6464DC|nr:N-acetylmuramoyl-L-alanine amidase [Dongia deserti]
MRIIGWILGLLLLLGGTAEAVAKPAITDARLGVEPELTRVVISLTQRSDFRVFTLADPYRVVIDLSEVDWKVPSGTKLRGQGLVAGMRYGLFKAGTSRVVLDLMEPSEVARAELLPPENGEPLRLLVDLRPVSDTQFRAQLKTSGVTYSAIASIAPVTKPTAKISSGAGSGAGASAGALGGSAAKQPTEEPKRGKPVIVIDPGHGGIDPGAIGSTISEKQLTLAVAKVLKEELEGTGKFRVLLTRSRDVYIPLRERFGLAREKSADLFISLHADSHNNPLTRGASVYTLSEKASDAEAAALAAKENKSDVIAGVDLSNQSNVVSNILIDLAQRDTKNMSTRFASLLVRELKEQTLLLGNTHRFAGFAVLKAPDVPSVLVEMGYITSSKDEALLSSSGHQKKLARAVRKAVENYFSWQELVRRS